MHLVIIENKLLVDLPKKVRMEHQNVFAHAESDYSLIAGKIQVGWPQMTSPTVSRNVSSCRALDHLPQTHSALVNGSQAVPGMIKSLG